MAPLIEEYKQLWATTFGDPREFIDDVLEIGTPVMLERDGRLVSALLMIPYHIAWAPVTPCYPGPLPPCHPCSPVILQGTQDYKDYKSPLGSEATVSLASAKVPHQGYSISAQASAPSLAYYIYGVVTHPNYRRRGLAAALLQQAHEQARAAGAAYCFLIAADEHLQRYYMHHGYSSILPDSPTGYPLILHSPADWHLVEKYDDPQIQEPVQFYPLTTLPAPTSIRATALLSH